MLHSLKKAYWVNVVSPQLRSLPEKYNKLVRHVLIALQWNSTQLKCHVKDGSKKWNVFSLRYAIEVLENKSKLTTKRCVIMRPTMLRQIFAMHTSIKTTVHPNAIYHHQSKIVLKHISCSLWKTSSHGRTSQSAHHRLLEGFKGVSIVRRQIWR